MMVNKAPAGCKDLTERAKPLFFDAYICSYDYQTTHASMTPDSWLQSHKRTLSKLCNVDLYMDILSYNKKWDKCERLLDRALDDSPLGQHLFEEATTHILAKTVMEAIKTRVNDAFSHESHRTRENNAVLVENVKDEILEIKGIDNLPELILVTITYMDLPVKIPCEGIVSQIETYIEMKQREAGVVAGEVPPCSSMICCHREILCLRSAATTTCGSHHRCSGRLWPRISKILRGPVVRMSSTHLLARRKCMWTLTGIVM